MVSAHFCSIFIRNNMFLGHETHFINDYVTFVYEYSGLIKK